MMSTKDLGKFQSLPTVLTMENKRDIQRAVDMLEEADLLRTDIERKTKRLDEIKDELLNLQEEYELPGFRNGPYCFSAAFVDGRNTLSKEALIENGVDPKVIAESYRRGEGFWKKDIKKLEEE